MRFDELPGRCPQCQSKVNMMEGSCPDCGEEFSYAIAIAFGLGIAVVGAGLGTAVHPMLYIVAVLGVLYAVYSVLLHIAIRYPARDGT